MCIRDSSLTLTCKALQHAWRTLTGGTRCCTTAAFPLPREGHQGGKTCGGRTSWGSDLPSGDDGHTNLNWFAFCAQVPTLWGKTLTCSHCASVSPFNCLVAQEWSGSSSTSASAVSFQSMAASASGLWQLIRIENQQCTQSQVMSPCDSTPTANAVPIRSGRKRRQLDPMRTVQGPTSTNHHQIDGQMTPREDVMMRAETMVMQCQTSLAGVTTESTSTTQAQRDRNSELQQQLTSYVWNHITWQLCNHTITRRKDQRGNSLPTC
eukprot:1609261-Amphidinium_carterae.1